MEEIYKLPAPRKGAKRSLEMGVRRPAELGAMATSAIHGGQAARRAGGNYSATNSDPADAVRPGPNGDPPERLAHFYDLTLAHIDRRELPGRRRFDRRDGTAIL